MPCFFLPRTKLLITGYRHSPSYKRFFRCEVLIDCFLTLGFTVFYCSIIKYHFVNQKKFRAFFSMTLLRCLEASGGVVTLAQWVFIIGSVLAQLSATDFAAKTLVVRSRWCLIWKPKPTPFFRPMTFSLEKYFIDKNLIVIKRMNAVKH